MSSLVSRHLPAGLKSALKRVRACFRRILGTRRLRKHLRETPARRIVVGASAIFEPGWIPTEVEYLNLLRETDWRRFFAEASLEAILAEHVWEHLTLEEGLQAARLCHRFLKSGGYLRLAVPDGGNPDPAYLRQVQVGVDGHQVLYTHETLGHLLQQADFSVTWLEHFDSGGTFHHCDWSPAGGMIHRSRRFDARNQNGRLNYTSLIVDAFKR